MLKFNEDFIKNYDVKTVIKEIFLKQMLNILKIYMTYIMIYHLPERMKINTCNKLAYNLYDKNNYAVHIRALKQALNHGFNYEY